MKLHLLFKALLTLVILYGWEVWGCKIPRELWRNIEKIQMCFIIHNLKIKGNTHYPILLIEVSIYPIESMDLTRYLVYKNKINNMHDKRLHKIASNSNQNHLLLKRR
jgi:hypothetical protein